MAKCPECDYEPIAPSCVTCPKCGNREWIHQVGRRQYDACSQCKGTGTMPWHAAPIRTLLGLDRTCDICKGNRISLHHYRYETIDCRTGQQKWEDVWQ